MTDRSSTPVLGWVKRVGWLHPSYSMRTILNDDERLRLEQRSPVDPTYADGFIAVYVPHSGDTK